MNSILDNFKLENFYLEPFPHIHIENALPDQGHQAIINELPKKLDISKFNQNSSAVYLETDYIKKDLQAHATYDFMQTHSTEDFKHQLLNIFDGHIKKQLPLFSSENAQIADATLVVNPWIKGESPKAIRGPHIDDFNDVSVFLYYLKSEVDEYIGGDLELYRYKNGFHGFKRNSYKDYRELPSSHIEKVKTIPFSSNTFVAILDGLQGIHGVSPILKADNYRFSIRGGVHLNQNEPAYYYRDHLSTFGKIHDSLGLKYMGLQRRLFKK
jgi:hypothetical protein